MVGLVVRRVAVGSSVCFVGLVVGLVDGFVVGLAVGAFDGKSVDRNEGKLL